MNTEDYVSFPVALALKKAGFDWECDHYYCAFDNETDVRFWSIHPAQSQNGLRTPKDTEVADAPTLAQAQKWLREVKKWIVYIVPEYDKTRHQYLWNVKHLPFKIASDLTDSYTSYELALSAGIAAALELIEKKGE